MRATRTVITGILMGVVLATANVYLGLKVGFWESGGIIAVLIGYAVLRTAGSDDEVASATVVTQALASSSAAMPGTIGLLGAFPALTLLGTDVPLWFVALYGIALAVFGLLVGVLFREQLVVADALPFPSGVAIAETVQALRQKLARGAAWAAAATAAAAGAVTWLRDAVPKLIPPAIAFPGRIGGLSAESLTLGIGMSPLLVGFGLLIGLRNGLSLLGGAVLGWAVLAPLRFASAGNADYGAVSGFLLWPGLALMGSAGLVALGAEWRSIGRALAGWRGLAGGSARIYLALAGSSLAVVVLASTGFGVPLAASLVVLLGSILAALVCARAVGEAGLAPATQLGQLTQLSYGAAATAPAAVNVGAASIVAGSVVQTAQIMESFRVGQIIGVPPARQVRAALIGIAVGTLAALPTYVLLTRTYGLGSEVLPAPFAFTWKAVGEVAASGAAAVPEGAGLAALLGIVAGAALELLARAGHGRFLPSPVLIGLAFVFPAQFSVAIALGAIVGALIGRGRTDRAPLIAALGAGAIAGESVFGVLVAGLHALGLF